MATKTTKWDSAEHLSTPEDVAAYLDAVIEEAADGGDVALISHALGVVARAKGMSEISKASGLGRESLYKALSDGGNPSFATVIKVLRAVGMQLHVGVLGAVKA